MILDAGSCRIRPMPETDSRHYGRPPDYQTLVAEFADRVYRQALRMLGLRQDAEDATQEVFLKVFNGLPRFRGESDIGTWIFRITFNVCVTLRQRKKIQSVSLDDTDRLGSLDPPDPSSGPDEILAEGERLERLALLVARLPEREAAAITLFYSGQKSYEEISRILGIPPGSVATALHNGRRRLRAMLKEDRP